MTGRRRRRHWSLAEKRSILAELEVEGASVAEVAQRHSMNANLLFTWRRDPRLKPGAQAPDDAPRFLPIEIAEEAPRDASAGAEERRRVELVFAGETRASVLEDASLAVLRRLASAFGR